MPPVQNAAAATWTRSAAIEIGRPSQRPVRVTREGRSEQQRQREDEGRRDQLRPGARKRCEQDATERDDHRDLRDPLEARRRAVRGVDEPRTAEHDGDQGDRHRRRSATHRGPRDEQKEEGRSAGDEDAAEQEPAGENVEEAGSSRGGCEHGARRPSSCRGRTDAEREHARLEVAVVREHTPADAVVTVREVRLQRQHEQVALSLETR